MSTEPYLIPATSSLFEEEIKKSRFITYLAHTPGVDAAKAFVDSIKDKHKDARHNCWAFVACGPKESTFWGCSDDGEPSGTAGRPMLGHLSGSGVGEITAVVTRYFGGTKLGTGGLVKAYGGGVKQALAQLETIEKTPHTTLLIQCGYEHVSLVEHVCQEFGADITNRDYSEVLSLTLTLDIRKMKDLKESMINKSSGGISIAAKK